MLAGMCAAVSVRPSSGSVLRISDLRGWELRSPAQLHIFNGFSKLHLKNESWLHILVIENVNYN